MQTNLANYQGSSNTGLLIGSIAGIVGGVYAGKAVYNYRVKHSNKDGLVLPVIGGLIAGAIVQDLTQRLVSAIGI